MMVHYREIKGNSRVFYAVLSVLLVIILVALWATHHMEGEGHYITGMTNQIVWGMPHVFAVFLIVAASGALNIASISSVFGKAIYKPLARLSGLLAIAMLAGGLAILVLDLGHPDRLIVAMTSYNFKSIFAWNIFLYTGFIAIVAVYLWMMMEDKMNRYTKIVGFGAFIWRLLLTTGTGSIFGFLVARQAYDEAVMAPMFVALSFAYGLAVFIIVLVVASYSTGRPLGDRILQRLKNLLVVFIGAALYFVLVFHLTNLYATEHHGVERFLLSGGLYSRIFWFGQVFLGGILPIILFLLPATANCRMTLVLGSALVILGGLAQMYVVIIGGQAYPLVLFPGMTESSSFFDGQIHPYHPSYYEFLLGLGGVALAGVLVMIGTKVLRFLPESLADEVIDPHFSKKAQ